MTKRIAQIIVGLPVEGPFDYVVPGDMMGKVCVGQRVFVSFGRQGLAGVIVGFIAKSKFKQLKPILSLLDAAPSISKESLEIAKAFSKRYGCSWGEA